MPVARQEALVAEEIVVGGWRGDDADLLDQQAVRFAERVGEGRRAVRVVEADDQVDPVVGRRRAASRLR